MIWVNTFFTCGRSKMLSSEAWNLLANIQWDSFMSSIRSTSRILSMSLYSQTKHFFFCRFQNLNKNTSFQKHFSSNHIPPLPFHCGFVIMLWSIGNDILYVFDVDLELVYKTSHTSYHMTDLLHCILVFLVDCETHGRFMK